jgi:hypothetical protein
MLESLHIFDSSMQLITSREFSNAGSKCKNGVKPQLHLLNINTYSPTGVFEDLESRKKYFWISKDSLIFMVLHDLGDCIDEHVVFMILLKLYEMFRNYYGVALSETVFKQNFDTFCVILDEMIEGGHLFSMEIGNLESTVVSPSKYSIVDKLASMSVNSEPRLNNSLTGISPEIWWRRADVFHSTNELYIDVVENVNVTISGTGKVIYGSITGNIGLSCRLSGLPEVSLIFRKPKLFNKENVSFHPCVRKTIWERDQKVAFVPPNGDFGLMKYFTDDTSKALIPFNLNMRMGFDAVNGSLSATLMPKLNLLNPGLNPQKEGCKPLVLNGVRIRIRVPQVISNSVMIAQVGSARFDSSRREIVWSLGSINPGTTAGVKLEGSLQYSSNEKSAAVQAKAFKPTATVDFSVTGWSACGIKVDSVDVRGVDYTPYKGCRYATNAGRVEFRF